MGKLIAVVVVLAVLLGFGDVEARRYAESRVEQRINERQPGAASTVHVASFPFVPRLALFGRVEKISARVHNVSLDRFNLDEVDLTVSGVRLNRNQLVHGTVAVESIRTGTVRAVMSEQTVDQVLQLPVTFGDGTVELSAGGVTLSATVTVVDNQLRFGVAGRQVSVTIPELPVLPCVAGVVVEPGRLVLSCTFHQVPAALLQGTTAA
jgi:hypothetical protein